MSELVEPIVTQEFYEISNPGDALAGGGHRVQCLPEEYIATWAGEAGVL
jgi:hypothetical protein